MEVNAQFYENTRAEVGNFIVEIQLTDGAGTEQVSLTSADTDADKDWTYTVDDANSRIIVEAVVSPSNVDVPTGDYGGSILQNAVPEDITSEETFTTATLSSDDDELTVEHYVQIPEQV